MYLSHSLAFKEWLFSLKTTKIEIYVANASGWRNNFMKKELYKETGYPGIKQRISDNMYIVTIDLGRQLRLNRVIYNACLSLRRESYGIT